MNSLKWFKTSVQESIRKLQQLNKQHKMQLEEQVLTLMQEQDLKMTMTDAMNIVKAADAVRSNYNKEELGTTLSTRETLRAARMVSAGYPAMTAMELTFLPLFEGTKAEGERSIVWNAILAN